MGEANAYVQPQRITVCQQHSPPASLHTGARDGGYQRREPSRSKLSQPPLWPPSVPRGEGSASSAVLVTLPPNKTSKGRSCAAPSPICFSRTRVTPINACSHTPRTRLLPHCLHPFAPTLLAPVSFLSPSIPRPPTPSLSPLLFLSSTFARLLRAHSILLYPPVC